MKDIKETFQYGIEFRNPYISRTAKIRSLKYGWCNEFCPFALPTVDVLYATMGEIRSDGSLPTLCNKSPNSKRLNSNLRCLYQIKNDRRR